MEQKTFINRTDELKILKDALKEKGAELIILYGRRRIGKSRLLIELNKHSRIDLFVVMEEADYVTNLKKTANLTAQAFHYPNFAPPSFREIFSSIPDESTIVIDEFSYIYNATGEFQSIWEEIAKPKKLKIVLSGSLIKIMEDLAFSLKSPLYGRATKVLKLTPLKIEHVFEWYDKKYSVKEMLEVYFSVGGVPRYLEVIKNPSTNNIKNEFFSRNGLLLREGKLLLKESFPTSSIYPKIMFSVARGITEASKIANDATIKANEVSKYLSVLIDYGIVEKRFPVLGGGRKDVRFYMADKFFSFWTSFVWPFYNDIEGDLNIGAISNFDAKFQQYCGIEFEKLTIELLSKICKPLFFAPTKIGKQWGRFKGEKGKNTYEFDTISVNEKNRDILFVECKWQDKVDSDKIFQELKNKSSLLNWNKNNRKEHYAIFAKSFKKKEKHCYDLEDIKKFLNMK